MNPSFLIADFWEEIFFPMAGMAFVLSVPLVIILTKHQQRMAELMRRDVPRAEGDSRLTALSHEVSELRQAVHQQAIVVDNLAEQQRMLLTKLSGSDGIRNRLEAEA